VFTRSCVLALLLIPPYAGGQGILITDSFDDNERHTANLPESASWWGSGTGVLQVVDGGGGNAVLQISGSGSVRQAATFFAPVSLAVGEALEVSLRFTPVSTIPLSTDNVLRVALVNGAVPQTADAQVAGVMAGYSVWVHAGTNAARFRERSSADAGILTSLPAWSTSVGAAGVADSPFAWTMNETYEVMFRIERTGESAVMLTYSLSGDAGSLEWAYHDETATATAFDGLAIAVPSGLETAWIDDIRLEHVPIPPPVVVVLGTREVETRLATALGTPVIPMWDAPMPHATAVAAGFPIAEQAEHIVVWRSTLEEGAFNHHAALIHHDGHFFGMWSNHPQGEDASGQRMLYARSADAVSWGAPQELFPAPDEVKNRGLPGLSLRPDRWVVVDGVLYAIGYCRGDGGAAYPVARSVTAAGQLGEPFVLRSVSAVSRLPIFMRETPGAIDAPPLAADLLQWYVDNDTVSWWAQNEGAPREGVDRANLIEPFTYRAPDGHEVMLLRSHSTAASLELGRIPRNNRMYVSYRDGAGIWVPAYPTNIPDSPSRAEALVLPTGPVLLIGNQIAPVFDTTSYLPRHTLTAAASRDGYHFDDAVALRHSAPTSYRFQGIEGRTLGYGYPSTILHHGHLYSLYSVGKEDLAITRVPLASVLPNCLTDGAPEPWQQQYCAWLYAVDLPRGLWAPDEDATGEGIPNLLRFAFGMHPLESGSERLPMVARVAGPAGPELRYQVTRNPDATAVELRIEVSRDLATWVSADADLEVVIDTPERLELRVREAPAAGAALFIRTRVITAGPPASVP